jgi:hypothetical protein
MKKINCLLLLPLVVVIALALVSCETKKETKPTSKTLTIAKKKANEAEKKKWEASPDGIKFNAWKSSPEGKKVQASYDKIKKYLSSFSPMEAVVTSVTFQRENTGKTAPKWLVVKIDGEDYMMQFTPKEFVSLKSLKVNDKIIIKSRNAGLSNNHPYLIIAADSIEHNAKVLYKRDLSKNDGC